MARSRLGYSPALDGVRGAFMLCFMAFHFGLTVLTGAWVGINLFFVLSAFLITRQLVEERVRTGTVDALAFYGRRARRLLPALFLVLGFVLVYARFLADEAVRRTIGGDVLATLGYVMNWRLVLEGDQYFGDQGGATPLRHAWTLAIEEQFYVIVPLVVLVLMAVLRTRRAMTIALLVGALASAAWTATLGFHDVSDYPRLYYGTDTRAQALFVGAALGVWLAPGRSGRPPVPSRRVALVAGALGVASSVVSMLLVGPYSAWMFNAGGMLLFAVGSALLVLACVDPRPNWVVTAFGWRPLAYIGRLSYGLYLWHWPIRLLLGPERFGGSVAATLVVDSALTILVAHLSYRYLERPVIKHGVRGLLPRLRAPAAAIVVPVLVLGTTGLAVAGTAPAADVDSEVAAAATAPAPDITPDQQAYEPGSPERIAVYGDSVPYYLAERFPQDRFPGVEVDNLAEEGCDLLSAPVSWAPGFRMENKPGCTATKKEWPQRFEESGDQVLLIYATPLLIVPHIVDGERVWFDDPAYAELITDRLDTVREQALDAGAEQVQIVTVPCREASPEAIPEEFRVVIESSPQVVEEFKDPRHVNGVVKDWADRHEDVRLVDLHGALCPDGYRKKINDIQLFNDYLHFSPEATPMVWKWVLGRVSANWAERD
ncbi:acyltransferase family protein [Janibacter corallicola]|uniref:acyltransferase family protein n=1 Tax=Janibacter corallicola TaxID=415212 RepID=UPI00082DF6F6|nr:acyltransferase family protein [Janibacter corallicola]